MGNIRSITIDPQYSPVEGTVNVYVSKWDASYNCGVYNLYCIDLTGATVGNIIDVRAEGDIALDCDVHATSIGSPGGGGGLDAGRTISHDVDTQYLTGNIWCQGMGNITVSEGTSESYPVGIYDFDYYGTGPYTGSIDVTGSLYYVLIAADMAGTINVVGDVGLFEFESLAAGGSLTIDGDLYGGSIYSGDLAGDLAVLNGHSLLGQLWISEGSLTGNVTIDGDLGSDGLIYLPAEGSDLSGTVTIAGDAYGHILIGTTYGDEECEAIPQPPPNDLTGSLTILGDANGDIRIGRHMTGHIEISGDSYGLTTVRCYFGDLQENLSGGYMIIHGSLMNTGQIRIPCGFLGDTEFVAVNYDGGVEHSWQGRVIKEGTCYYGNTPAERLWDATICRGDADGDATVGYADINPFIMALLYPEAYSLAFPGLGGTAFDNYIGGSRIWHGDANCDGSLDFGDINPFTALVISGCCDSVCPGCEDQNRGGGGQLSPEELAAQLAANVSPELYNDLLALVAANIDLQPDEESQAYWEAAYAALTE